MTTFDLSYWLPTHDHAQAHELWMPGTPAEAIEAYRSFLQNWEEADPDLPWLGEARAALDRLVTKQG